MAESVRCSIRSVLEDLRYDELQNFKANLHEYQVKPGYVNIPRGQLQNADALDLSNLLFSYYDDYAMEVATAVLLATNCNPQAQRLLWAV